MSEMMCCPLGVGDDCPSHFSTTATRKAAKDYRCIECRETIPKGTKHEYVSGVWDGDWSTFRTCLSCVEIRNHFSCGHGWVYGEVWQQLEDNFFPDMKAGGQCMTGLSPEAKARLFDRRLKWLEDSR